MGPLLIIIHYHLFKNAGTSVDAMLAANFGDEWVEHEFAIKRRETNSAAVREFLIANPGIAALSSHTAQLPVPHIEGVEIFPIIFVRHPLLRIRSAYIFESTQRVDTGGARLARSTDFAGYVTALLERAGPNQVQNFQTSRLALIAPRAGIPPLERALGACETLPFVGLVERYGDSIARLTALLRPQLPDFQPLVVRRNVTVEHNKTHEGELDAIRDELGEPLYRKLLAANARDMAVHEHVSESYLVMA